MVLDFLLIYGPSITFVLGITNLLSMFLVFFTCRCMMGKKLAEFLWQNDWYKRFYTTHCYWWWVFFISVAVHAAIAIIAFGIPRL
ncbi:MAG: hypothetical protein HYW23_02275 [Candidatus Aenigmarchaeota archaeon]|nr:hypothetical protein [Candidatus Aenigmarchaeota archaeon]